MNLRVSAFLFLAASPLTLLAAEQQTASLQIPSENLKPTVDKEIFSGLPVFDFIKLDQPPVVKSRVAPLYPIVMRQAQVEGEVMVDFIVTNEGKVVKATAVKSTRREFESAAIFAVSKWKFSPGIKGGKPVNTHMQVPIAFSLE
jgi:protein TonB